ncbi:unnamed protein product [Spirodela intermedia]|uniref:Uncharacterized protein n=2 Tax=Spirodela intermedia TaxID=51605 RepID=A0ABN7E8G7_SPIIN|nr:unnamed protein product [Spirodela intermedia]CAA7401092.1 unnamed protein product [Spirodela intermedia]
MTSKKDFHCQKKEKKRISDVDDEREVKHMHRILACGSQATKIT